jgi:hypothetical protein
MDSSIQSALTTIPTGLKPPIEIDLESTLPPEAGLVSADVGLFYIIQDMDVLMEGRTGKAWANYKDGNANNPVVWYRVYDQYYSADGITITLTPTGQLQIAQALLDKINEAHTHTNKGDIDQIIFNNLAQRSLVDISSLTSIHEMVQAMRGNSIRTKHISGTQWATITDAPTGIGTTGAMLEIISESSSATHTVARITTLNSANARSWWRTSQASGWWQNDWQMLATQDWAMPRTPTILTTGADLNTYITPGFFATTGAAMSQSIINKPASINQSFELRVGVRTITTAGLPNAIVQEITTTDAGLNPEKWLRCSSSGIANWSDWVQISTGDTAGAFVPDYSAGYTELFNQVGVSESQVITIAEDGFVACNTQLSISSATTALFMRVQINGLFVGMDTLARPVGASWTQWRSQVYPVKKGDTVQVSCRDNTNTAFAAQLRINFLHPVKVISPTATEFALAPDTVNMETINRISTNGGEWVADRNGFVRCSMTPTVQGRLIVLSNGNEMIRMSTSIPQQIGSIMPVTAGDRIRINVLNLSTGDVSSITCQFIPPVSIIPPSYNPLPTQPHLWRNDGVEIDFGDGTFGRRFIGTTSGASGERTIVSLSTDINGNNAMIEQITGRAVCVSPNGWCEINAPSISGTAQPVQALAWMSASNNDFRLSVEGNAPRTNAPYDVRIRYTKV